MEKYFRIEPLPDRDTTLCLPGEHRMLVDGAGHVTLEFGAGRAVATLGMKDMAPDRLGVSEDLLEGLRLPLGCDLRLRMARRRVCLGPVVGILAARNAGQLTPGRLQALENHLLVQGYRGGVFVACHREGLDPAQGCAEGYRFRAHGDWEPGVFALPRVIFRRFGVPLDACLPALHTRGVRVFNERVFDKWEAWRWLAADPGLRPHLPQTRLLRGAQTVIEMLAEHPCVFVKPVWGSLGASILRVQRSGDAFTLEAAGGEPVACADAPALATALTGRLPRPGIVQQGLALATAGDRLVDFRVVVQKDGSGRWRVPGMVARCGAPGLFLSNMATGGFPVSAETGLGLLFGQDPIALFHRREELADLALRAAAALERGGLLLADLGLDVAYGGDGHPWLIEANNRDPDHNIGWEQGSWPLFYRFRTLPLEFACLLAGFGDGEGGMAGA